MIESSTKDNLDLARQYIDIFDDTDFSPEKNQSLSDFQKHANLFKDYGKLYNHSNLKQRVNYKKLKIKYDKKSRHSDYLKISSAQDENHTFDAPLIAKRDSCIFRGSFEPIFSTIPNCKPEKMDLKILKNKKQIPKSGLGLEFKEGKFLHVSSPTDQEILNDDSFITQTLKEAKSRQNPKPQDFAQKPKSPTPLPDDQSPVEFQILRDLIQKFHLKQEIKKYEFQKLKSAERRLFLLLLNKHFRESQNGNELPYPQLVKFSKNFTKKRNEEKIKQIWKRFLKSIYEKIRKNQAKKQKKERGDRRSRDKWRDFYQLIFQDLIGHGPDKLHLDLVMDICSEKTVGLIKSKTPLTTANNWKSNQKVAAMKKIPASFRYLVSLIPCLSEEFKFYVSPESPKGIIASMKKIIQSKLDKMFTTWEDKFSEFGKSFQKFLAWIEEEIKNPKFKLPWLIQDIEKAAQYCIYDFKNDKLRKEFHEIKRIHYTQAKPVAKQN